MTLGIVGKALFNFETDEQAQAISRAMSVCLNIFKSRMFFPWPRLLEWLPLPRTFQLRSSRKLLNETIDRMIAERRKTGEDRKDLLSMLLRAQDPEGDGKGMTDRQVRDEAMTLFLAGHETTANALTWTWYLLAQNPEVERKLQAEVDKVLGDKLPTLEDLPRLNYVERVFAEALRLYPPGWILDYQAVETFELNGTSIPKGALLVMSQYVIHRDPRYYPDPERFDPDRWTPEAKAARPRFSFFPFGGGPRGCIGEPFAWMEAVFTISILARQWQARLVPGYRVEIQPTVTLRPKNGVKAVLVKRNRKS